MARLGPLNMRYFLAAALPTALSVLGAAACREPEGRRGPVVVAAAADLSFAFEEVGAAFGKTVGEKPKFAFGSTGLLAKQIEEGAPFDVFAAANVAFVDEVVKAGACDGSTQAFYARGRIVLWSRKGAGVPADVKAVLDRRFAKIAIANPEHAPYGRAAKEAFEHEGVWASIESRIVYGENVQQTLKFAQSGNADVAVVALSLATVTKDGEFSPIDGHLHQPIDQALVVCNHGKNAVDGRKFTEFVNSTAGRTIMRRYGFLLPGEAVAQAR